MITVLVVDDHELVRTGICRMLEDHADVQVIGQAESGEEAINLVRQHHPPILLVIDEPFIREALDHARDRGERDL